MQINSFLILTLLLSLNCRNTNTHGKDIFFGKYYFYDKDSTYLEVHVLDSSVIVWGFEHGGSIVGAGYIASYPYLIIQYENTYKKKTDTLLKVSENEFFIFEDNLKFKITELPEDLQNIGNVDYKYQCEYNKYAIQIKEYVLENMRKDTKAISPPPPP